MKKSNTGSVKKPQKEKKQKKIKNVFKRKQSSGEVESEE